MKHTVTWCCTCSCPYLYLCDTLHDDKCKVCLHNISLGCTSSAQSQQAPCIAVMCAWRLAYLIRFRCCCADLHTLHGLQPVVQLLSQDSASLQAAAAFVLGTAASNNNKFQEQLMQLHPESISLLMQVHLLSSCFHAKFTHRTVCCSNVCQRALHRQASRGTILNSTLVMQVTASANKETSKKGLYAIAALLRNNVEARALFYTHQGTQHLVHRYK